DVLCLSTGSQGEAASALSRIAINDHRSVKVGPDDTVVLSARAIPGNEKAIGRVMNHLARRGAEVIYEGIKHVHVSGQGSDEVLRDRRHLAEDGLVVPVVAINKQTGALEGVPDIITRGFVMEDGQALLADGARLLADVVAQASVEERTDQGLIKEKLRVELRRFF